MSDLETAELQRELNAARAELQDLTYRVSHDLRAPLRHIHAFSKVIQEDWPDMPAPVAEHLGVIQKSAQLLTQQLDGLTQLSRISQQPLVLQALDVVAMVQEIIDERMQKCPNTPVHWHLTTDMPMVCADAFLLRQVWSQLIDNALKFSRNATPAIISLTWQKDHPEPAAVAPQCRISLQDNGVGFAPGQELNLFKLFGRLHSSRDFEGLGLGLLRCRKILQRLGGTIDILANPLTGCCVTLGLPLAMADVPQTCCA